MRKIYGTVPGPLIYLDTSLSKLFTALIFAFLESLLNYIFNTELLIFNF